MLAGLSPVAPDDFWGAVVFRDADGQAEHMVAGFNNSQDAMHPVQLLLTSLALDVCRQSVLQDAGLMVEEAFPTP